MSNTDAILAALQDLKTSTKEDLTEIKDHLARLNGRTRKVESGLAVHWVLWGMVGAIVLACAPILLGLLL